MRAELHKYHGNGNDFILIDNRTGFLDNISKKTVAALCHRRFGVGADGLILLNKSRDYGFEMKYFNSDGNESTMCGNGGRCILKFAHELGIISEESEFLAIDGPHRGVIKKDGTVMLKMKDVATFKTRGNDFIIDTGSPHYVRFVKKADAINVKEEGRKIRNQPSFKREGINVNFVEVTNGKLKVRTYERGVEDETYSCGTGVVASSLISSAKKGDKSGKHAVKLSTPGGDFRVIFSRGNNESFYDIWLIGKAEFVFKTEIELKNFSG